jgi:hypothetical protein
MTKDAVKRPMRTGALRNERPKEVLLIRVKRFSKVADGKDCSMDLYFIESPI